MDSNIIKKDKSKRTDMQFVLVTDSGINSDERARYNFKNFTDENQLIQYVSNISNSETRVYKIFSLDKEGNVVQKTIGFKNGKFSLVNGEIEND
jgi:hypothetical protein